MFFMYSQIYILSLIVSHIKRQQSFTGKPMTVQLCVWPLKTTKYESDPLQLPTSLLPSVTADVVWDAESH